MVLSQMVKMLKRVFKIRSTNMESETIGELFCQADYSASQTDHKAISEALESQMPSVFESVRVYKNSISVTQDASTINAEAFSYSGL